MQVFDAIEAMRATLALARDHGLDNVSSDTPEGDYEHLRTLLDRAEALLPGGISEAQVNRWLGWMQACVYVQAGGDISIDDITSINEDCADG